MAMQFDGKVALVTGAGSGIGQATALAFAEKGAKVVVSDYVREGGEETVRLIKEAGGEAIFIQTDVSKPAEVKDLLDKIVNHYGRIDCAHNNAGIALPLVPLDEITDEQFDAIYNVNLKGVFSCMRQEIRYMLQQGAGAIVNTASMVGLIGMRDNGPYCATKHGVIGLTRAAALDYAQKGIRVNCVCPGFTLTPMVKKAFEHDPDSLDAYVAGSGTPLARWASPDEIARVVVFLCSDNASYVTGHAMVIDGGYTAR